MPTYEKTKNFSQEKSYLVPSEEVRGVGVPYAQAATYFEASRLIDVNQMALGYIANLAIPSPIIGKYIQLPDGSVNGPALSFAGEVNTGRYRIGTNNVGEAVSGDLKFDWNASRLRLDNGFSLDITDMTSGSVLFAGSGGRVSQDNGNLFWNDSTNRLGILTSNPTVALDVNGDIRDRNMSAGSVLFADSTGIISQDNTNFFWNDGQDFLRLTSTTGKQLQLRYNASNDLDIEVDSLGDTYIKPTTSFILQRQGNETSELWIDAPTAKYSIIYFTDTLSVKWSMYRNATNNDFRIDDDSDTRIRIYQTTGNIGFGSSSEPLFWDNTTHTLELSSTSGPYIEMDPVGNGTTGEYIFKMASDEASTKNFNFIMVQKANATSPRNNVHFKFGYNVDKFGEDPEDTSEPALYWAIEPFYETVSGNLAEFYLEYASASATPDLLRPFYAAINRGTDETVLVVHSAKEHVWRTSDGLTDMATFLVGGAFFDVPVNVGTTTSAAAAGDFAAGLSGAETFFYDQSAGSFTMSNASGTTAITADATPAANGTLLNVDSLSTNVFDGLRCVKQTDTGRTWVAWQQGTVGWRAGFGASPYSWTLIAGTGTPTPSSPGTTVLTMTTGGQMQIGDGSAGTPAYSFSSTANLGFYRASSSAIDVSISGSAAHRFSTADIFIFSNSAQINFGGSADVKFSRDAAGVFAIKNSTNAQTLRLYTTFTDTSNYERLAFTTASGTVTMVAETAGTGADDIDIAITPAGVGKVKFGTHSAIGAETVTGYVTIKDSAGNTRKLAVVS